MSYTLGKHTSVKIDGKEYKAQEIYCKSTGRLTKQELSYYLCDNGGGYAYRVVGESSKIILDDLNIEFTKNCFLDQFNNNIIEYINDTIVKVTPLKFDNKIFHLGKERSCCVVFEENDKAFVYIDCCVVLQEVNINDLIK